LKNPSHALRPPSRLPRQCSVEAGIRTRRPRRIPPKRRLKNVRFTPPPEGRFCRGWRTKRESAITYEFSARGACAEKRMSFRCRSRWHLSVVFRSSRKRVEITGLPPDVTIALSERGGSVAIWRSLCSSPPFRRASSPEYPERAAFRGINRRFVQVARRASHAASSCDVIADRLRNQLAAFLGIKGQSSTKRI
jgi:hypothetical protein